VSINLYKITAAWGQACGRDGRGGERRGEEREHLSLLIQSCIQIIKFCITASFAPYIREISHIIAVYFRFSRAFECCSDLLSAGNRKGFKIRHNGASSSSGQSHQRGIVNARLGHYYGAMRCCFLLKGTVRDRFFPHAHLSQCGFTP
jgi:hypothetical protein